MTTPDNQPTANAIAAALSSDEWAALEAIANGGFASSIIGNVIDKGFHLVTHRLVHELKLMDSDDDHDWLTTLGESVLATRASAPVAEKPATVTAETFYREYYAEKINRGECDVWWEEDHSKVAYLRKMNVSPTLYEVYFVGEGGTFANVYPEREFTVTWLTQPQPAPSQPVSATAEGSGEAPVIPEFLTEMTPKARENFVALFNTRDRKAAVDQIVEEWKKALAERDTLRQENQALRDQNARLRTALLQLNDINYNCITYSQQSLADFTEGCAYVGRKPMEQVLDVADDLRRAAKEGEGS